MKSIVALLLLLILLGPSPAFAQTFEVILARAPNNIPACARGDAPLLVKFVVSMSGETGTVTNTSTAHVTPYRKVGDGIYAGSYQSPDRRIFLTGVVNVADQSLRVEEPSSGCIWSGRAVAGLPPKKQQNAATAAAPSGTARATACIETLCLGMHAALVSSELQKSGYTRASAVWEYARRKQISDQTIETSSLRLSVTEPPSSVLSYIHRSVTWEKPIGVGLFEEAIREKYGQPTSSFSLDGGNAENHISYFYTASGQPSADQKKCRVTSGVLVDAIRQDLREAPDCIRLLRISFARNSGLIQHAVFEAVDYDIVIKNADAAAQLQQQRQQQIEQQNKASGVKPKL